MTERDRLIVANIPLVRLIIKRHFQNYTCDDDVFQIGCVGLIKAADTYDSSKGFAFGTYAGHCIKNEISVEFRKKYHKLKCVSLEESIIENDDGSNLTIGGICAISKDEYFLDFMSFVQTLTPLEKNVISYILSGMNQSEIADAMGYTQPYISRIVHRIQTKFKNQ